MKKLIAVILAVMSFTAIQTSAVVERMYYDFTFADGYYYDLITGVGKSDARFAVSSRKPVKSDSITIVGSNWHHILWWGDNNQYIGYHNSTNSSYKTNLFNAYETSYDHIDVIDNDSFETTRSVNDIYNSDWVLDNIIPGVTYTITYDVTLLYKSDRPYTETYAIAHFRLYKPGATIYLARLLHSQYLDWDVGETVHVENTIKIPADVDLSDHVFQFGTHPHEGDYDIMRVDNVRLTAGTTIPTGQYFGTAGSVVTPPENAKYFSLQVCKDRDNLINFERDTPIGDLMVVNKNTIRIDRSDWNEPVYVDYDDGLPPDLLLKYGDAYYIEYTITKLEENGLNDDDVGIFFWWPEDLDPEDIGLEYGPPITDLRLAQGIDNDLFQSLPLGDFAWVTGTFIADDPAWEGGPGHGHIPPPDLWLYTTVPPGSRMEFGNVYILPAGSYDMYITSIHIDPSEVYMRFCATQAYYERVITETPTVTLPERLDNWLDTIGLNNTFLKILLSVVLMTVVAISLALMHAPASVVIFGTVLVLALVAFFGWIPLWIIIMAALVLLLTTIFKLKGAGGGNVEDD
jgi:hypothetical protein